jgi:broad specificity phosphatase PhoE
MTDSEPMAVHALPDGLDDYDVCNDSDELAKVIASDIKLVWHIRHGQSTGNVARDRGENYQTNPDYTDTPLSKLGKKQAREAKKIVSNWREKPCLVVSSAMTRSIQTAAIIFEDLLKTGDTELVIRPEIREYWPG